MIRSVALMTLAVGTFACTTTRPTRTAKRTKMPPAAHGEDFTLGEARQGDEASGSFLSTEADKNASLSNAIPGIAPSEDPTAPEEMFGGEAPDELSSSISKVIDELAPIHVFVVTTDTAVRAQPTDAATIVATLPKGRRLVGLPQGEWICIGKGQFVGAGTLMPYVDESDTASR